MTSRQNCVITLFVCLSFLGCKGAEEPTTLEKTDVDLPVIVMPDVTYPIDATQLKTPRVESIPAGTEVAIEGEIDVADAKSFQSDLLTIKFTREIGGHRVIAQTGHGGRPALDDDNRFRYRCAVKSPKGPGQHRIEIYMSGKLINSAEIDVISEVQKDRS